MFDCNQRDAIGQDMLSTMVQAYCNILKKQKVLEMKKAALSFDANNAMGDGILCHRNLVLIND